MNPIENLLAKKMHEAEPALNLEGTDGKLLQIANQDLKNYLRLKWDIENEDVVEKMEQTLNEDPAEFETFLSVWTSMWMNKWRTRVKLFLGNQDGNEVNKAPKIPAIADTVLNELKCKQEITQMVQSTLIKNGEICGTDLFTEYLLKLEIGNRINADFEDKETIFAILSGALRRARDVAQIAGPVIFVKVEKAYFTAANTWAQR